MRASLPFRPARVAPRSAAFLVGFGVFWAGGTLSGILPAKASAQPISAASTPRVFRGDDPEGGVVAAPRLLASPIIDGALGDARDGDAWSGAARLTGFSQYAPRDGVPASDSTEVWIGYTPDALYVGVRAFSRDGRVNATLADRDRIQSDDFIQILIDPYRDGRRAFVFGVNPLGVQADGIRIEGQTVSSGGMGSARESDPVDLSPDFVYASRGRLTDFGYEVEIRIPFRSLRFPSQETQTWGLQILRQVQSSGETQVWTPALRGRASFLAQGGTLTALSGINQRQVLDLNPVFTSVSRGRATGPEGWGYSTPTRELGLNLRWGVTPNLSISGTVNPDFSQVESDAGQVTYDPRRAIFIPEKRPFFLEGSERFEVPNRLIYTRRIVSPDGAVKAVGKLGGWDVGLLSARDGREGSALDAAAFAQIARLQRGFGTSSSVGFVWTDRREGEATNQVLGVDTRIVLGSIYTLSLQAAGSRDALPTGSVLPGAQGGIQSERTGALWNGSLRRRGPAVGFEVAVEAVDADFIARNGFVSRSNQLGASASVDHVRYGQPNARVQSWTRSFRVSGNWLRTGFFSPDRRIEDWRTRLSSDVVLAGGWRLGTSLLWEQFYYPDYLYVDYAIEAQRGGGATDTIPFIGTPAIMNLDVVFRLATPRFPRFSGNVSWIIGRDENYDEWAPGIFNVLNGALEWRPEDRIRVESTLTLQQILRPADWSTVSLRTLPRVKLEYQASRSVFVRLVGQYDARFKDAFRDDSRTGDPILIRNSRTGIYERSRVSRSHRITTDVLFSYQPSPGTVVFVGYGANLSEPEAYRFRELERAQDQFFVKGSYLLRR